MMADHSRFKFIVLEFYNSPVRPPLSMAHRRACEIAHENGFDAMSLSATRRFVARLRMSKRPASTTNTEVAA